MSLTNQLSSAMSIFTKAKSKLEKVVSNCEKREVTLQKLENVATEAFDQAMKLVNTSRTEVVDVQSQATKSIEQINKILGE